MRSFHLLSGALAAPGVYVILAPPAFTTCPIVTFRTARNKDANACCVCYDMHVLTHCMTVCALMVIFFLLSDESERGHAKISKSQDGDPFKRILVNFRIVWEIFCI